MSKPHTSVFIPTFNRTKYLRHCLGALEKQTIGVEEFVIVVSDNASDEDSEAVVREFPNLPIEFTRMETNIGLCGNFNRALDLCPTEFILLLPDDVTLAPGFIARASAVLRAREHASMYGAGVAVSGSSQLFVHSPFGFTDRLWPLDLQEYDFSNWANECIFRCPVYTGAALFRRRFLLRAMPWPADKASNADRLMYFAAARQGDTALYESWIGAQTIYDGHNFGAKMAPDSVKQEYREVTGFIYDECLTEGIDPLNWWQSKVGTLAWSAQQNVLMAAEHALPPPLFEKFFSSFPRGRLERAGVPRALSAAVRRALSKVSRKL